MKTKMFLSLLLLATVVSGALAAADEAETKAHSRSDSVLVSPVEDPAVTNVVTNTAIVPNDPKQVLQDYDSLMIVLTQKFSVALATIADAAKRGDLSSEQPREMSAEQYQLTHMQFELLSLWRGIEEQGLARIPDVEAKPDSTQGNEVVVVALPFSSFQLNPSLATYLSLTSSQVEAIQQVVEAVIPRKYGTRFPIAAPAAQAYLARKSVTNLMVACGFSSMIQCPESGTMPPVTLVATNCM